MTGGKMQTEGKLPFPSLIANRKQVNRSVIQANLSDIQANRSADFHYDYPEYM